MFLERHRKERVGCSPVLHSYSAGCCLFMIWPCGLSAGSEPPWPAIHHGSNLPHTVSPGAILHLPSAVAIWDLDLGSGIWDFGLEIWDLETGDYSLRTAFARRDLPVAPTAWLVVGRCFGDWDEGFPTAWLVVSLCFGIWATRLRLADYLCPA